MADLRITCPHCKQDIQCDELWVGHELQCPICQGAFTVPAPAAASGGAHNPLVPKPPAGGGSRLSVGQAQVPAQPGRNIPIRNLTEAPRKKRNPLVSVLVGLVVVAGLGVGGYFGFGWVKALQDKANGKSAAAARNSDGSEAGNKANLNNAQNATEPGGAGLASVGANAERPRRSRELPVGNPPAAAPDAGTNQGPVVPPKYMLDIAKAAIPEGKVNGVISGSNFVAETVSISTVGTAQVLRMFQGQSLSPDREMLVYLHLKAGEKLGGQSLVISNDMKGAGVPQVAKRWKPNPRYAPSLKSFNFGYAMRLELGQVTNDTVAGKIFLALPDTEQSVAAGLFTATVHQPDPNLQPTVYTPPTATPPTPTTPDRSAMDRRYGIRR